MAKSYLDFEKPIIEIEEKINEIKQRASMNGSNVDEEVRKLEKKVAQLQKNIFAKLTPWQKTQIARDGMRPYTLDYISLLMEDFFELHGDRAFGDDAAMIAGLARFQGEPVAVVGHQKGRNTRENIDRNFGMPNPEGYRKALRIMKMAEKFKMPLITFIDTPGAYPGLGAEERGQGGAIAYNLHEMVELETPIIVVVTGEGGSGGALAIGVGDRILILEHSVYSVISPESCSSILWRETSKAEDAAKALKLTAQHLKEIGAVDRIVPEPLGGAHRNHQEMAENLRHALVETLEELKAVPIDELVEQRFRKFRSPWSFGTTS
jgi:acetyl-CoA carboxylase carboxyl transferase subunit alpha